MERDEDIRAALPEPPPAAPVRRTAAIEAAMRRFDGAEAPVAGERRPPAAPPRPWFSRPQIGLVASALLVALIAGPTAWMTLRHPAFEPVPAARVAPPEKAPAGPVADKASGSEAVATATPAPPAAVAKGICAGRNCVAAERSMLADAAPPPPSAAERDSQPAMPAPAPPPPAPPPPPPASQPQEARRIAPPPPAALAEQKAAADAADDSGGGDLVVTGSRISRSRSERGDWNACTLNDPRRALPRCKSDIAGAAKGGNAAASVGEGLARGWDGETDEAIAAFDRAIAAAPRSSLAYLNRGLAYQKSGELDRAIADFDRAIRFAPTSARAYYIRSEALRQRGDTKRADRDLRRAIDLDPKYRAIVD